MSNHYVLKCKKCKKIIEQCRCPDLNKEVRWGLCDACKAVGQDKDSEKKIRRED